MDSRDGGGVRGTSGIPVASLTSDRDTVCMRKTGLALLAAASLASAVPSPAAAQSGAVLSGIVRDSSGSPVPGVVLTVTDPVQADTRVAVTNQGGAYSVDRLRYGREYVVHVSHPRFRTSRVRARANEGDAPAHMTLLSRRTRLARAVIFPLHVLTLGLIGNGS